MAKKLYVITATSIKETGSQSYIFMIDSDAPYYKEYGDISHLWGMVKLREKGENEVNPWKLARGEPGAIGPDGIKKWQIFVGNADGQQFFGSVEESPDEKGLQRLLAEIPDCTISMLREHFDRFQKACEAAGIKLGFFHFAGELATSHAD